MPCTHQEAASSAFCHGGGALTCYNGNLAPRCRPRSFWSRQKSESHSQRCWTARRLSATGLFSLIAFLPSRRRRWRWTNRRVSVLAEAWKQDGGGCELTPDDFVAGVGETEAPGQGKVALLLNRNAKGISRDMERSLMKVVGREHCFVCCSEADAATAIDDLLDRGCYDVIVCGGGDGTVASVMNILRHACASRPDTAVPALSVLRLGTGNALAFLVGAGTAPVKDLTSLMNRVQSGKAQVLPTSLLRLSDGPIDKPMLCFFAGLGYDARILRDYMWLRSRTKSSLFRPWVHSPFGYILALLVRTLPATLRREHVFNVRVTNLADEAFYVDPRKGDWAIPKKRGEVLYDGEVGILCASSEPFYGGGLQLFPFAGLNPGFAHLRLAKIHPVIATLNVLPIWRGTYRNAQKVHDFLVKDVLVEADRPAPLHHSGDLISEVTRLRIQVDPDGAAQLVDLDAV